MSGIHEAGEVLKRAKELLERGAIGGLMIRQSGCIEQAIPVRGTDDTIHSWFVPVTVGDRLAGFCEFQPDLSFMRYSSFQRRDDDLQGCPDKGAWIDADSIRQRAETVARPGENFRKIFLSYDRVPSRLAWAVVFESPGAAARTVFVAGDAVWEAAREDEEDSFAGG